MKRDTVVGVDIAGEVEFHLSGIHSDYTTLCGLDACDSELGHNGIVQVKVGQKITCSHCYAAWSRVMKMKAKESDFSDEAKRGVSE